MEEDDLQMFEKIMRVWVMGRRGYFSEPMEEEKELVQAPWAPKCDIEGSASFYVCSASFVC